MPLGLRGVSDAVMAAAALVDLSTAEATASAEEQATAESASLRESLGLTADASIPAQLRSQFKAMEERQKRRARRGTHDALDRTLIDLTTVFRDVLTLQLGTGAELVNAYLSEELGAFAARGTAAQSLTRIDAIAQARHRIGSNVAPLLAMEALMVTLLPAS